MLLHRLLHISNMVNHNLDIHIHFYKLNISLDISSKFSLFKLFSKGIPKDKIIDIDMYWLDKKHNIDQYK